MAASTENVTLSPLLDTIDILNGTNTTQKEVFVASTEGMLLSYSFLLLSALLCVYFGSYRSITRKDKQKQSGEKPDVLTAKDGKAFFSFMNIEKKYFIPSSGYVPIYCKWIFIWNLCSYITCFQRIYNICIEYLLFFDWNCRTFSCNTTGFS
jgi:hypothetical protein